ncbi:MAG: glucosaminidase domain-containing protein [Proteobacteria bacterium]|nr:glucosaminidase domain-containing protein [Pseudomonadota bacterium]
MSAPVDTARKIELFTAAAVACAMIILLIVVQRFASSGSLDAIVVEAQPPIIVFPDFASIQNIQVKKQQFFDYLQDYIAAENRNILALRKQLHAYADIVASGAAFSTHEKAWVLDLADAYRLDIDRQSEQTIVGELLLRVDVIPISLVLAQAANESAWGTSRFALEGNNIFGQWCYEEGCGIVPMRRASGATHEVKRFSSVEEAVGAYFLNINTHHLYQYLRELRGQMRQQQQSLDPMVLAFGLGRYSARGDSYVDEVQTIIIQNELRLRDQG